jgi:hypothetical protein
MYFDTSHYLLTLAVGIPCIILVWLVTYRRWGHDWRWRLGICVMLAITITPTAMMIRHPGHVGHSREMIVYPAVSRVMGDLHLLGDFIALLFQGSLLHGYGTDLFYGVMPIMLTTEIVFCFWTYLRSRQMDAHAA